MKNIRNVSVVLVTSFVLGLTGPIAANAATTPSFGAAATYGILSSTYTNTVAGTTINGDIGFTTGPAVVPAGVHTNYGSSAPFSTAGIDQGNILSALASQPCSFTFAPWAVDLATDTTHGPIGVYTPGVYCISGAASIGTAGITLNGNGTYIFRIDGALTTVANSAVTLNGASACDVFWTPTQATTLGANSTFAGTDIDAAGITVGAGTAWTGMALAFGGTVTTDTANITAMVCTVTPPVSTGSVVLPVPIVNTGSSVVVPTVISVATPVVSTGSIVTPIVVHEIVPTSVVSTQTIPPVLVIAPRLPHTGLPSEEKNIPWNMAILAGILMLASISLFVIQGKRTI